MHGKQSGGSIVLVAVLWTVVVFILAYRLTEFPLYLLPVLFLSYDKISQLILFLTLVIKGWLFCLIVEVVQKAVEIFTYVFLLILNLFIFGLSLPSGIFSSFFILKHVDQCPSTFFFNLILVVAHLPQQLLRSIDFQLSQITNLRIFILFDLILHILFGGSFFLRLIDIRVASFPIGWVCKPIDLYFAGFLFVLEKRIGEVPGGELQLFPDHSGNGDLLLI